MVSANQVREFQRIFPSRIRQLEHTIESWIFDAALEQKDYIEISPDKLQKELDYFFKEALCSEVTYIVCETIFDILREKGFNVLYVHYNYLKNHDRPKKGEEDKLKSSTLIINWDDTDYADFYLEHDINNEPWIIAGLTSRKEEKERYKNKKGK